ncbi:MAG TPA: hypothetical protein VGI76_11015 [Solirubrobacteraceae bacterium]
MLNGQIYRAACLPLLFALAIAGFSLSDRPAPLTSNLAPEAFQGERAEGTLSDLVRRYPGRRPGGTGDQALADALAGELRALGGAPNGSFAVAEHTLRAQTIDGMRTLTTVVAQRPGTSGERPIAILARRDATAAPDASELSATAVLLELARVFSNSETRRGIVLVSTSGGSGGNAGARDFANHAAQWVGAPLDAAIVLGGLGGPSGAKLFLGSLAGVPGTAPELLQRTVAQAVRQQAGTPPGAPTLLDRLAQLSFPLAGGEQAPLDAGGLPAVLLQVGGELPSRAAGPPTATGLQDVGRAALASVYALDAGPSVTSIGGGGSSAPQTALALQRKLLPEWAVRLLLATLLLPALLTAGDGLARQRRRRRVSAEQSVARWVSWVAACALPFFASALLAILLGALDLMATPYPPVASWSLALHGTALAGVLGIAFAFALVWRAWPALMRRLALPVRAQADPAGLALVLVLGAVAVVVWVLNPYTALLFVPALHLWLLLADPERWSSAPAASRRAGTLAVALLGAAPLVLLIAFYAQQLGLGPGGLAQTAVLLLAGGRIGLLGAVLWSLALGCLAAAILIALAGERTEKSKPAEPDDAPPERELLPIRGPMSYAGPGSLGGTESALRR